MIATTGRIWEAASSEKERPHLACVAFDADKATLSATDSFIAARVPCKVEAGDESGLIPAAALKEANGQSLRVAKGKAVLKLPGGERSWDLVVPKSKFPDLDELLNKAPEVEAAFGLNPDLLARLGRALGSDRRWPAIALHPAHPLRAIRTTSGKAEGIIMPIRLAFQNGATPPAFALADDEAVIAAVQAAITKLKARKGKRVAASAFREALVHAQDSPASATALASQKGSTK